MTVGRNDDCPCGSGNKFKRCCEGKSTQQGTPRGLMALIGVIVALAGIGFIPALINKNDATVPTSSGAKARSSAPIQASAVAGAGAALPSTSPNQPISAAAANQKGQPPYPGAVWSAAHNHWHKPGTTAPAGSTGSPINIQVDRGPQPVEVNSSQTGGPGTVWSQEHGHWHKGVSAPATGSLAALKQAVATPMAPTPDNPTGLRVGGKPVTALTAPPGPAPAGQVWSAEHGHWHDVKTGAAPVATPAPAPKKE
jgi:hypothetical protein